MFAAFEQLSLGDRFFWTHPAEQHALVGAGVAQAIETRGTTRVTDAAQAWRQLQQHAIIDEIDETLPTFTQGPVLYGGFTFDSLNPSSSLWSQFPAGLLILPRLLFHCDEKRSAFTINIFVDATTQIELCLDTIEQQFLQLQQAITDIVHQSTQSDTTQAQDIKLHETMPAPAWKQKVSQAVETIQQGDFEKVVLARSVQLQSKEPFDILASLRRLYQSYASSFVFAIQRAEHYFIGATPERLVCGMDGQIQTMALAGSAPRGATEAEDQRLEADLFQSLKNQGEHLVVVNTIRQALSSLCSRIWTADTPRLLKLNNIQHLETPIIGDLLPGRSILDAIEDLHPTPAVGGHPQTPALAFIRENELLDRGWYASPIGWVGTSGNGEFAVALRSGLVTGNQATLFAGCGIVADSDPESEYQESGWKLQVMLRGLGGDL
jgi:isochorismate synthase